MSLAPGARLGPYEIISPLGAGGMGEVYRARDTRLNRDVALKVLPEGFALDPDRLARFTREAQVLASLNHPHIAAIYGLERADGVQALVLELVEGPTLADRIARGRMPMDEVLPVATQIAEALEAAHEQGIIHRDLKPANIKVTPDGVVKVLDFGLAKAFAGEAGEPNLSNSPTLTVAGTNAGVILGTAAYMSPEQAKGKVVDRRTDIFAFGCVLYEMLTGRPAFPGDTVTEILARVIEREPDWTVLPPGMPPRIQELLLRCLEKDPRKRRRDSGDVRLEIEQALTEPARGGVPVVHAGPGRSTRPAWIVAGLLAVGLAAALAVPYFRAPADAPEMRLEITTPPTSDPVSFAISPDGQRLVFVASADGQPRLYLRPLDTVAASPLAGTEGAGYAFPFWSPDSRSIGFFGGDGKLTRVDIGGGPAQVLAQAQPGLGGTWGPDGTILFAPFTAGPLFRVPASGGEAVPATTVEAPRQAGHIFPTFLPDGRQFLYYVRGTDDVQGIYLGSLDAPDTTRLTAADTPGLYVSPGWLLFMSQGTLVARRFDPARRELSGETVTVAASVGSSTSATLVIGAFSASAAGLIAYRSGGTAATQLTWFDRSGKALGTLGPPNRTDLSNPALSPDGRRVAFNRTVQNNTDVWVLDGDRMTRFTSDAAVDLFPIWSPDGNRIVFDSNRKGIFNFYQKASRAEGSEEPLLEGPPLKIANDVSPDGRFLMYFSVDPKTATDLWVLPLQRDPKPFAFLNTSFAEVWGQFSPDGRWVAYQSNESGPWEIFVRPFQGPGGQWPISTSGGVNPRWSLDGRELYYIDPTGKLMAAAIAVKGTALDVGTPVALFQTRILGGGANMVGRNQQYDVAPDGRFLINVSTDEASTSPITVILNWAPAVKK